MVTMLPIWMPQLVALIAIAHVTSSHKLRTLIDKSSGTSLSPSRPVVESHGVVELKMLLKMPSFDPLIAEFTTWGQTCNKFQRNLSVEVKTHAYTATVVKHNQTLYSRLNDIYNLMKVEDYIDQWCDEIKGICQFENKEPGRRKRFVLGAISLGISGASLAMSSINRYRLGQMEAKLDDSIESMNRAIGVLGTLDRQVKGNMEITNKALNMFGVALNEEISQRVKTARDLSCKIDSALDFSLRYSELLHTVKDFKSFLDHLEDSVIHNIVRADVISPSFLQEAFLQKSWEGTVYSRDYSLAYEMGRAVYFPMESCNQYMGVILYLPRVDKLSIFPGYRLDSVGYYDPELQKKIKIPPASHVYIGNQILKQVTSEACIRYNRVTECLADSLRVVENPDSPALTIHGFEYRGRPLIIYPRESAENVLLPSGVLIYEPSGLVDTEPIGHDHKVKAIQRTTDANKVLWLTNDEFQGLHHAGYFITPAEDADPVKVYPFKQLPSINLSFPIDFAVDIPISLPELTLAINEHNKATQETLNLSTAEQMSAFVRSSSGIYLLWGFVLIIVLVLLGLFAWYQGLPHIGLIKQKYQALKRCRVTSVKTDKDREYELKEYTPRVFKRPTAPGDTSCSV